MIKVTVDKHSFSCDTEESAIYWLNNSILAREAQEARIQAMKENQNVTRQYLKLNYHSVGVNKKD